MDRENSKCKGFRWECGWIVEGARGVSVVGIEDVRVEWEEMRLER